MNKEAFIKGATDAATSSFAESARRQKYYDHPGTTEYPWPGSRSGSKYSKGAEKTFYDGLRAKGYHSMWNTGNGDMVMKGPDGYHTWDHELGAIVPMLYSEKGEPQHNKHYDKVTL